MKEILPTKRKVTQTASRQEDSLCKGVSKYRNRRTKPYYRQNIGGGCKYRLGTVSDTWHWGFKPGLRAPNLTLIPSSSYKTHSENKCITYQTYFCPNLEYLARRCNAFARAHIFLALTPRHIT